MLQQSRLAGFNIPFFLGEILLRWIEQVVASDSDGILSSLKSSIYLILQSRFKWKITEVACRRDRILESKADVVECSLCVSLLPDDTHAFICESCFAKLNRRLKIEWIDSVPFDRVTKSLYNLLSLIRGIEFSEITARCINLQIPDAFAREAIRVRSCNRDLVVGDERIGS